MNVVEAISKTGLLDTGDIARVLGTTERSVQRWANEDSSPRREALDHLLELKAVLDLALEVCRPGDARIWLRSPIPALGYDKPLDLIRDREYRRVIAALTALAEGVTS
jgi:putative toxin-antitoxin system antitoxin component (TIGR02293 family)